jgi:hypothetical protein
MPTVPVGITSTPERRKTIVLHGDHGAVGSKNKTAGPALPRQRLSKQIVAWHERIEFSGFYFPEHWQCVDLVWAASGPIRSGFSRRMTERSARPGQWIQLARFN